MDGCETRKQDGDGPVETPAKNMSFPKGDIFAPDHSCPNGLNFKEERDGVRIWRDDGSWCFFAGIGLPAAIAIASENELEWKSPSETLKLFYLSFSDKDGWRGGTHVWATDPKDAITWAWRFKINPGGEVLTIEVPDPNTIPKEALYRLITDKKELERLLGPLQSIKDVGPCSECGKETHE